jgi:hypothetical protein
MIVLNIILMVLISAAIFGWLLWSVLTQHRDPGCEHLRIVRRRLEISVRFVPLGDPPTQLTNRVDSPSAAQF